MHAILKLGLRLIGFVRGPKSRPSSTASRGGPRSGSGEPLFFFWFPSPNPFEGCRCGERLVDPIASNLEALALEIPNVVLQRAVDGVADPVGLLAVEGVVIVGLGLGHFSSLYAALLGSWTTFGASGAGNRLVSLIRSASVRPSAVSM